MNKKLITNIILLVSICLFVCSSCDNKENNPIVAINIENPIFVQGADYPDNKFGYVGTEPVLAISSITAENGISKIVIEIHNESFEMDTTFIYNGETELKDFYKHLFIPDNAPAGNYLLHIRVYDNTGQSLTESMDIKIRETGITLFDSSIGGADNETSASDIHVELLVMGTDSIQSIRALIYKADAPTTYYFDETFTDIFLHSTENDVKRYIFHEHLVAPNATEGEYIIEFRVYDAKGAYLIIKDILLIVTIE